MLKFAARYARGETGRASNNYLKNNENFKKYIAGLLQNLAKYCYAKERLLAGPTQQDGVCSLRSEPP
jgi:hypothetical protein